MAATSVMTISPEVKPVAGLATFSSTATREASRLMQKNHDDHHVFFNQFGFHDHIAHHILSLYALGATPEQMLAQFNHNSGYQRPITAGKETATNPEVDVGTPEGFMKGLAKHENYTEYLTLFTTKVKANGVAAVLDEYVFADTEIAKTIFSRLNSGIIHPIIHFGLATEFDLPGMTAESLAWTAMHKDELGPLNRACEAKSSGPDSQSSLLDLYVQLNSQRSAVQEALPFDKFSPDMCAKIAAIDNGAIVDIISKYRVTEANVEARIYEAINVQAYAALAAQHRPYTPKVDFFGVHGLNGTVYFPAFLKAFGPKKAACLVEHQIRACMITHLLEGAPAFDIEWTTEFVKDPSKQGGGIYNTWEDLFAKGNTLNDDGHIVKAIRALKGAEAVAGKQTQFKEPLRAGELLGLTAVLMRSVENEKDFAAVGGATNQWVRKAGFDEAWSTQGFKKIE